MIPTLLVQRLESELENERSVNAKNLEAIEHQQTAMRRFGLQC